MILYGYRGGFKPFLYVATRGVLNWLHMSLQGGFKTALVCYNEGGSKPPL